MVRRVTLAIVPGSRRTRKLLPCGRPLVQTRRIRFAPMNGEIRLVTFTSCTLYGQVPMHVGRTRSIFAQRGLERLPNVRSQFPGGVFVRRDPSWSEDLPTRSLSAFDLLDHLIGVCTLRVEFQRFAHRAHAVYPARSHRLRRMWQAKILSFHPGSSFIILPSACFT